MNCSKAAECQLPTPGEKRGESRKDARVGFRPE
jgi:hypothetical protein